MFQINGPLQSFENLQALYLNFGYYIGCLPFKINYLSNEFIPVPIAVLQLFTLTNIIFATISDSTTRKLEYGTHAKQVHTIANLFWLFYASICIWTVWTKQEAFQLILNTTQHVERLMKYIQIPTIKKWQVIILMVTIVGISVLSTCIQIFFVEYGIHNGTLAEAYKRHIQLAHRTHFFKDIPIGDEDGGSLKYQLLGILHAIGYSHSLLLTIYFHFLCLTLVIPLYFATRALIKHLSSLESAKEKENLNYVLAFVDGLLELSLLSDAMTGAMSLLITGECFSRIPYHCSKFKEMLDNESFLKQYIFLCLYGIWFAFLLISAHTNSMVKGILPYLRKTHKFRYEDNFEEKLDFNARLSILLTEITENNFGVRGVGFTVTYGFIGNLAGLIITYSIIIYQF